ncbi:RAMP2 protein, partial [Zapornia atra]|nr:RAMP2 protein [Zapornia atra]
MALRGQTGSGQLSRGLLLLWALLGTELCHTSDMAKGFSQETNTSLPVATFNWAGQSAEEAYVNISQKCWEYFVELMSNVTESELCEWQVIRSPYSILQVCLESWADHLSYGYPNALAEQYIFQSHHRYFHNCTVEHHLDPPEDVLLAMIMVPICLIPFSVTVVIWRSKNGKTQP